MIKRLISFFFILTQSKIFLKKPKPSQVIFIGKPQFHFSLFSEVNFDQLIANENNTIGVWKEYFYLHIIIKCLLKFKFSFQEYCEEYIKLVKPKLIITFLDNYDIIYKLKAKNSKKIVVQNSYRYGSNILNFKSKEIDKNSIDHFFVYNKNIGNFINKHLNCKIHPVGSFLLNSLDFDTQVNVKYKYLYVSAYRRVDSNNNKISSYTSYIKFQEQEKKLVKLLSQYLFQTNQTLNILGGNKYLYDEEYKYFKDILKENKNWNFIKPEKRHYSFPYRCVNSAEIILGIDSSLLYESIALGKKTIFFNCRVLDKYLDENRHFGWPKKFDDEGFFWTKNLSLDSISSKINSIDKLSKNEWNDGIKDYKSHLLNYDKSNKTFNDTVSKIF